MHQRRQAGAQRLEIRIVLDQQADGGRVPIGNCKDECTAILLVDSVDGNATRFQQRLHRRHVAKARGQYERRRASLLILKRNW